MNAAIKSALGATKKLPRVVKLGILFFALILILSFASREFHHDQRVAAAATPTVAAPAQALATAPTPTARIAPTSAPTKAPAPQVQASAPVKAVAPPTATQVATPSAAPIAAPAQAKPAPAASAAGLADLQVTLPAGVLPSGAVAGRADYALNAAPEVTYGTFGPTVGVGTAAVADATSQFSTFPVASIAALAPTHAKIVESWTFWTRAQHSGLHLVALRLTAAIHATASVVIDGETRSVASVESYNSTPTVSDGQVGLAAGWHKVQVSITHNSRDKPGADVASIFLRGPASATPTSITPWAVAAAPAASAPASAPASSSTGHRK